MTTKISCDAHDYFEIICMRRSLVKITTKDNKELYGRAIDIYLVEKQEYLKISDGINVQQVLLSEVKELEAVGNDIAQHNFIVTL